MNAATEFHNVRRKRKLLYVARSSNGDNDKMISMAANFPVLSLGTRAVQRLIAKAR